MSDGPITTIKTYKPKRPPKRTEITVSFGEDTHYDVRLQLSQDVVYDVSDDGVESFSAGVWFGGLTPPETPDDDDHQEVTAWRAFGEDELRALAKAFLTAAGKLSRLKRKRPTTPTGAKQ